MYFSFFHSVRYSFHGKFVNLNCIICFWFVFTEKFVKSTCTCKSCLLVLDLRHLQTIYSIWFERLVCLSLTPFFWKIPFWVSQFMLALVQVYFRNKTVNVLRWENRKLMQIINVQIVHTAGERYLKRKVNMNTIWMLDLLF